MALAFFAILEKPIKKHATYFYIATILISILTIIAPEKGLPFVVDYIANDILARGTLAGALFILVMVASVCPAAKMRGLLLRTRGEMAIIAALFTLIHNISYGQYYFVKLFTNISELDAQRIFAAVFSLIMTYIPFKINPSGVIPIIFASSFLTFPISIATTIGPNVRWLNSLAHFLRPNGWWYNILYLLLIVFFAYFYTQISLNPTEIAKQIRENGGSIPGIRTDKTEEYLQKILNRLILPGSLYLALIAVLPTVIQTIFGFPQSISMLMGGTSLLILVGVDLDTMSQIEAQLKMHHHEGLVKRGKLRSRNL